MRAQKQVEYVSKRSKMHLSLGLNSHQGHRLLHFQPSSEKMISLNADRHTQTHTCRYNLSPSSKIRSGITHNIHKKALLWQPVQPGNRVMAPTAESVMQWSRMSMSEKLCMCVKLCQHWSAIQAMKAATDGQQVRQWISPFPWCVCFCYSCDFKQGSMMLSGSWAQRQRLWHVLLSHTQTRNMLH